MVKQNLRVEIESVRGSDDKVFHDLFSLFKEPNCFFVYFKRWYERNKRKKRAKEDEDGFRWQVTSEVKCTRQDKVGSSQERQGARGLVATVDFFLLSFSLRLLLLYCFKKRKRKRGKLEKWYLKTNKRWVESVRHFLIPMQRACLQIWEGQTEPASLLLHFPFYFPFHFQLSVDYETLFSFFLWMDTASLQQSPLCLFFSDSFQSYLDKILIINKSYTRNGREEKRRRRVEIIFTVQTNLYAHTYTNNFRFDQRWP